ncbi:hypothetical protein LZC95_46880 [Pendulispora brunnea]|uniref:Uncharacterized protein n=1 Tax=Pendulispora brunnea TaxID=2905690 RepID=A0ABZ2KA32_9BACT
MNRSISNIAKAGALPLLLLCLGSCRNTSRFSTGDGHYEGTVINGSFVRFNVPENTRMCLTLDMDRFQSLPGTITTSDGLFKATALEQIPQIWHDPLSTLSFGEGREKNMIYVATPLATELRDRADVTVVVSLMSSGDVEVRLMRSTQRASPDPQAATALFGVFVLQQHPGNCPI